VAFYIRGSTEIRYSNETTKCTQVYSY